MRPLAISAYHFGRGNQVAVYEINYISDGILLEVMVNTFLPSANHVQSQLA
jgi:hypothetical protein